MTQHFKTTCNPCALSTDDISSYKHDSTYFSKDNSEAYTAISGEKIVKPFQCKCCGKINPIYGKIRKCRKK